MEQTNFYKACTKAFQTEETDPFGIYVGKKMKVIKDETQKMLAECLITKVLHKAMMNKLTENTTVVEQGFTNIVISSPTDNNSATGSLASYYSDQLI